MVKEISIDSGIFISGVTLRKDSDSSLGKRVEIYKSDNYVGSVYLDDYRFRYLTTVADTKYYTIEKRG